MPSLVGPVVEAGVISSTEQPTFRLDEQMVLRPFAAHDADAVVSAFETPDIQYFHFRTTDHAEALQWIEECNGTWGAETGATWAITDSESDDVVGRLTCYLVPREGHAEVAYWLLPAARGRNLAAAAASFITAWAHGIGMHRVTIEHVVENDRSARVAQTAGFRREGIKRGGIRLADGWHDVVVWSHLASDDDAP